MTGNLKRLGVPSAPMDGRERLALLHSQMHPGRPGAVPLSCRTFPGRAWGDKGLYCPGQLRLPAIPDIPHRPVLGRCVLLADLASELSDKLLAEILELDAEMTVTMHIQTVDQLKAIKTIKGKLSDIGKMKVGGTAQGGTGPGMIPTFYPLT